MISVKLHTGSDGVENDIPVSAVRGILERDEDLLWVDVTDPTDDDMDQIGQIFQLHALALEDTNRQQTRPKIDQYDEFLLIVFYGLVDEDGDPVPREIDLFVSPRYVVTIHDGPLAAMATTAERWVDDVARNGEPHAELLLYTILDTIVEDYLPVIGDLGERVDAIEASVLDHSTHGDQRKLLQIKRDLGRIRRIVGPARDILRPLAQRDTSLFSEASLPYFRALYDDVQRVSDAIDMQQEQLENALDVYLSMSSYRLNEVVKRLTAWSIILMTVTLIAGIYGMNFVFMPELDWFLGYPFALALMLLVTGVLAVVFRKIDWW